MVIMFGSIGACLDSMLPGVQVTAGFQLRFFLHLSHLSDREDSDSLL